jgi:hypothetical protein
MESFSGGMNPNIGKKFITLEDGSSVEAPDGVRDLQDYNEYLEEQRRRAGEADAQAEKDALHAEAVKLASKIENSVDEKLVKSCLASGDYGPIFNALAGVDGVPTKGDQVRIDQDGRKLGETHDKYDAVMAEAMEILRNEYFGEATIEAAEVSEDGDTIDERDPDYDEYMRQRQELGAEDGTVEGEESDDEETEEGETEKSREKMLNELYEGDDVEWLAGQNLNMADVRAMNDEDLAALYARWIEHRDQLANGEDEGDETEVERKPLVAVELDRTKDAEVAARDIAERMLKEDLASGGKLSRLVKGIWRGNMFRGYYIEKNKKLAYDRILAKQNGDREGDALDDADWRNRSEATIDRFISEYDEMIHKDAGEWRQALPDDHPAAMAAKEAISKFATGTYDEETFKTEMARIKAMLKDENGNPKGEVVLDNYLELARAARGRFEHEEGIESIMEGFKFIHGEARTQVRTEAHMGAIDKLVHNYEHSRFGRFVPPELIAGAASIGLWLTQTGATSAVRAATFGLGGAAVTGLAAGLKERGRVAVDRAQMARERASGLETGITKYDVKVMGTLYELAPAGQMTAELRAALDSDDPELIMQKLASAEVRNRLSDGKSVDLIGYSDPAKVEDERFALDLVRAEAMAKLRTLGKVDELNTGIDILTKNYEQSMDAKDVAFRKLRNRQAIKQGLKTAAVAAGTMFITQEVVAAFSPNSYGLADKAFESAGWEGPLNLGVNNENAQNTLLAGLLGFKGPDGLPISGSERIDAKEANGVKLSDEEVAQLKAEGYTVNRIETTVLEDSDINMSASEYAEQYGTRVARDDWGSNGTRVFDGNELRAHYTANGDGIVTRMTGDSTTWGGESINFDQAVQDGKIKAFISLTGDSQRTPIEVAGQLVNSGGQIEFIPEPGSVAAECFQDGKFVGRFFEIAYDNGVSAEGVQHMIPLATVVGQGLENGTFTGVGQVPVTEVAYNVLGFDRITETAGQVATDRLTQMSPILPFVRRDNLSRATRREQQPTPTTAEPTGGDGGNSVPAPETETPPVDNTVPEETPAPEGGETQTPEGEGGGEQNTEGESEEGGEGETEGEPGQRQTEEEILQEERARWEALGDQVGGASGVSLLMGEADDYPEDFRNILFQDWWNKLSTEIKDRFAGRSASERLSPESDALYDWLHSTGKTVESQANAAPTEENSASGEQGEAQAA